ncbi:dedicator of cytokinesis protein 1 isoform X1 [Ciona intestinalis]
MPGSGWILPVKAKYGVVVYSYYTKSENHLNLSVGDVVHIIEEYEGTWYRGFVIGNKSKKGVFPSNYVHLKEAVVERRGRTENIIPTELPIVQEVTNVLREWGTIWKNMYKAQDNLDVFKHLRTMMREIIEKRKRVLSGTLPADEMTKICHQLADLVDVGNRLLKLDLSVRNEKTYQLADIRDLSSLEVFRMHEVASTKVDKKIQEKKIDRNSKTMVMETIQEARKSHVYSLYVAVKNFVCRIGEEADVFMSLYDGGENVFISENYYVRWGSQGLPKNIDMLNNLKAIFTDLGSKDLLREKIFLVCKIIRIGRMELKEVDHKKRASGLRRAFGVAVMDITSIMKGTQDSDEDKQLFIPFMQVSGENENLQQVITRAISSREINHKGQGLWVSLKMLHGDLKTIRHDFQHLVDRSTAEVRKMGFPEIIMPGDVRNDLYVTIVQGEFEKGIKSSQKNVEVTMCVCNDEGHVIPMVVSMGSGENSESQYRSHIYYQNKSPKWMETVKVVIPIEDFYSAHLRFTYRHRSTFENKDKAEKDFGLSYVRLMKSEGTTLQDGVHNLLVYKVESRRLEPNDAKKYLSLPPSRSDLDNYKSKPGASPGGQSRLFNPRVEGFTLSRDTFQISTLVCSTKLTQNVDLLGLLKWQSQKKNLKKNLQSLMKVDGEEVVKFLQDTLDALFNIMMEHLDNGSYDALVFDALIYIIALIAEKKFYHFHAVLDSYILEHFSATLAYEKLTKVLVMYLDKAQQENYREPLMKALKALEYIFKFIVRSRILFQHFDDKDKKQFEKGIRNVFEAINRLMKITDKPTIALQATAMKYLTSVIKDIITVFDPKELSLLLKTFVSNVPAERLTKQKVQCMLDIVHSDIFKMQDCRIILLKMMTHHLKQLMEKEEELETCGKLLADILTLLRSNNVGSTKGDIQEVTNMLLRTVIRVVIKLDRHTQQAGNFVACLISMLRQMEEYHYDAYLSSFPTKTDLMDFLMEIFSMFQDLISNNVYRLDWVTMLSLQNSTFMRAIKFFTKTLNKCFLDAESFQFQLWNNFFHLAVAFLTQESLQMENFTHNKRQSLKKKYGDLRCEMGYEIRVMWFNLGPHKIKFIPGMVGPMLEMTLIPEPDLRRATIPIFFDMMQCELHSTGNFKSFETEMITKLDVLVEGGNGDQEYRDIFHEIMSEWCGKHQYLRTSGIDFVNLIKTLLGRLLDYRDIIREENRDNRMSCTVNLLNFYKDINRLEMYARYLFKLHDLHTECDNYTEAGFTLLQHARLLSWSDEVLETPNQRYRECSTHRELKEAIYYNTIDLFKRGKMWEEGIKLCKELAVQHEVETFRYQQLSEILTTQAQLYRNITDTLRPEPQYFFVGFYGQEFPAFQRNRTFIYRGKEYEPLCDFTTRTLNHLPNAQKMNTTSPPDDGIKNSNKMYVQIFTVAPIMEIPSHFKGKTVDDQILSFYKVNELQRFQYSKPFRKGPKDKDNEFASMWIERYTYTTRYKLPGILRWFEIEDTSKREISPLENAMDAMETANEEIRQMILKYYKNPEFPINPLSMKLNGVVDPRVMGGFTNYEKAFFTDTYMKENSDDLEKVSRLKDLIALQVPLLAEGVRLHGELAPSQLQPFHQNMESSFQELKTYVEKQYGKRPVFELGRPVRRVSPQRNVISMKQPRPESILSMQSNTSDHYHLTDGTPPEVPAKRPTSRLSNVISRSTSLAAPADKPGKRGSRTSEFFVNNFGSTNSLDKSVSSISSTGSGSGVVELREELTPQRPRRPKSQVGIPGVLGSKPVSGHKSPPPLPVKHQTDQHHEEKSSPVTRKPPPPLPVKQHDSSEKTNLLPPKKPGRSPRN